MSECIGKDLFTNCEGNTTSTTKGGHKFCKTCRANSKTASTNAAAVQAVAKAPIAGKITKLIQIQGG